MHARPIIVIGQIIGGHRTAVACGIAITLQGAMLNLLSKGAQLRAYLAHADELGVTIDSRTVVTAPHLGRCRKTICVRGQIEISGAG